MTLSSLKLDVLPGQIALVTFDTPGSRANTLGQAILGELEQILAELGKRNDLTGLVFRSGKPGMFIAGADLKELGTHVTHRSRDDVGDRRRQLAFDVRLHGKG